MHTCTHSVYIHVINPNVQGWLIYQRGGLFNRKTSKVLVLSTFSYYHVAWDAKHGTVGRYERHPIQGIANVKDDSAEPEPAVRLICHPGPALVLCCGMVCCSLLHSVLCARGICPRPFASRCSIPLR